MKRATIPVLLLTGYLGAGKTTLLNRILANEKGIRFAVIVNDIGEVNIDASLIEQGGVVAQQDDNLLSLTNGCICCTLKTDLLKQLHDLATAGKYDYIVIEASGICEPAPIANTICNYDRAVPFSEDPIPVLDNITTVVDAKRLKDEFHLGKNLAAQAEDGEENLASLVIQQIEFCNLILVNKSSLLEGDELPQLIEAIHAIQPKAEIIPCDYCDVPLEKLLHTDLFDFNEVAGSARWIEVIEGDIEDEEEGEAYEYGIETFVYYRRKPFSLALFDDFVARHWSPNIIRCKGMCYFAEEYDMCYIFEQAGKEFNLRQCGQFYATMPQQELDAALAQDALLRRDWDETYGDRMQKLVFIGQNLDKDAIVNALDKCIVEK